MIAPGTRVLVTGASGFIGGRLVERLAMEGTRVRVLVREIVGAAPLSRFPIEIVVGDLLRPETLGPAADGCDVVFNCAKGNDGNLEHRRAVDVDGARNLVEACARASVDRIVQVGTVVTYEIPATGTLDEHAPTTRSRDSYATSKRDAVRLVLEITGHGRPTAAVVHPTVVYGPRAGVYGRDILEELRAGRIPLVDAGRGACNAVYVDDVVTALLLAATSDRAPGEEFLVSGAEPATWKAFFAAFERMLGVDRTVPLTRDEAIELWQRSTRRSWLVPEALRAIKGDSVLRDRLLSTREGTLLRRAARRALPESLFAPERWQPPSEPLEPEPPLAAFRPDVVDFLASRATVSIDKARRLLGYEPQFDLAAGMALVERWASHVGLLDHTLAE